MVAAIREAIHGGSVARAGLASLILMEKESLLQLVAEILEVDAVSETENLENQGWDSLANLSFIAEADMRAGIEINADELADAQTVEDLFALVQRA